MANNSGHGCNALVRAGGEPSSSVQGLRSDQDTRISIHIIYKYESVICAKIDRLLTVEQLKQMLARRLNITRPFRLRNSNRELVEGTLLANGITNGLTIIVSTIDNTGSEQLNRPGEANVEDSVHVEAPTSTQPALGERNAVPEMALLREDNVRVEGPGTIQPTFGESTRGLQNLMPLSAQVMTCLINSTAHLINSLAVIQQQNNQQFTAPTLGSMPVSNPVTYAQGYPIYGQPPPFVPVYNPSPGLGWPTSRTYYDNGSMITVVQEPRSIYINMNGGSNGNNNSLAAGGVNAPVTKDNEQCQKCVVKQMRQKNDKLRAKLARMRWHLQRMKARQAFRMRIAANQAACDEQKEKL